MENSNLLLLNALESVLGKGIKKSRDNYAFYCPFCHHPKPKLEINLESNEKGENLFACWVCKRRGKTINSLLIQMQVPSEQTKEILKYVKRGKKEYNTASEEFLSLPEEFKPLIEASNSSFFANRAKKYLYKRGLVDNDFIKYNIGYATKGKYKDRVIIPSYSENNILNYFVARSFEKAFYKYINPEASKNIIFFENLINWDQPIILCEGVFDAMAIRRNAIPLLGKIISETLLKKITKSTVDKIYIALDEDARKDALSYAKYFFDEGKHVYFVDLKGKDPSNIGFINFTKLIQDVDELDFSNLLSFKLNNI